MTVRGNNKMLTFVARKKLMDYEYKYARPS
jgi:hypothetical protein